MKQAEIVLTDMNSGQMKNVFFGKRWSESNELKIMGKFFVTDNWHLRMSTSVIPQSQ
jgi:hypothetical protein